MTLFVSVARGPRMRLMGKRLRGPTNQRFFPLPPATFVTRDLALVRDRAIPSVRGAIGTVCVNPAVSAKIANLTLALFRLPVPPYKEGDIPSRERRGR